MKRSRRYEMTPFAKILCMALVLVMVGGLVFAGVKTGFIKKSNKVDKNPQKVETVAKDDTDNAAGATDLVLGEDGYDENGSIMYTNKPDAQTLNVAMDEWTGWWPAVIANGGFGLTRPGSTFDQLGIKVNLSVINDADLSSNAMINGSIDAVGYTINRRAFLSQKFKEAGFNAFMGYISNYSNGGDGVIGSVDIKNIRDLLDAKVGVPKFSEAHTLLAWWVLQSSELTDAEKKQILTEDPEGSLVTFNTPDEAALAMFSGDIDAAGTWEPYVTQAKNDEEYHVLFDTTVSSSLVMDGFVFSEEFAKQNPEVVKMFIKGCLLAAKDYTNTDMYDMIRNGMPAYSEMTDEEMLESTQVARLATWADNMDLLNGTAKTIYTEMGKIWNELGENVDTSDVNEVFTDEYIKALSGEFDMQDTTVEQVAIEDEEMEEEVINGQALLKKSVTIQFQKNLAIPENAKEARKQLKEFADTAAILNGAYIVIEGNTDPNPDWDPEDKYNIGLSADRADWVKDTLSKMGARTDRMITRGNGSSNPVVPNDTAEHRAMNRRVDVIFMTLER